MMASGQHVAGSSAHSSADTVDPITKFKILVPHLKESLQVQYSFIHSFYLSQFVSSQNIGVY